MTSFFERVIGSAFGTTIPKAAVDLGADLSLAGKLLDDLDNGRTLQFNTFTILTIGGRELKIKHSGSVRLGPAVKNADDLK